MTDHAPHEEETTTTRKPPCFTAWERFKRARRTLFSGEASGVYLSNRLQLAFEEGWDAARAAMVRAVDGDR